MKRLILLCLWLVCGLCQAEPNTLHLLCWSEYVPPAVVAGFTQEAGIHIEIESYVSNEQMLEKLRARPGYYDLLQPSGYYVELLAKDGALALLTLTRIPNARHLDPHYRGLPFDPENRWSIPWMAGTMGIVVNTALIAPPIDTWAKVFTGAHAGRIVIVDDTREMVTWALATLGLPLTDVSDSALAKTEPLLRRWLPQVAVFDSDSPHTALLDGRADLGIVWSGEAALLWQKDRKYRYLIPTAGAHRFVDNLAIPKNAPHQAAAAEDFIDYCLRPEISVLISRAYPYTNPNLAARALLTPEERENPASYPKDTGDLPMLHNEGNTTAAVAEFVKRLRH